MRREKKPEKSVPMTAGGFSRRAGLSGKTGERAGRGEDFVKGGLFSGI
ncbi:MAG: hypothetical protein LBE49_01315 [Deltaproteobacteria bacterium]|jgi:hypothetical protein|nr:hypothetical protein [Deltaproteobacteria bacterium]